jgi:RNA polymerase sigma-70 factor (ECF subfamily)
MFGLLFNTYWTSLCTFVAFITRDHDEAHELVADLFANLWERRTQWVVAGSIESYLFVAARNQARRVHRDAVRHAELLQSRLEHGDIVTHGQRVKDAGRAADSAALRITLEQAITMLPSRYQTAVYLRWQRDLGYEEIAEILEMTPAAAKKLVNRATAVLREKVREDFQ